MNAPRQMRFDVSTDRGLDIFLDIRNGLLLAGKKAVFELVQERRSLDQNALSFALYQQIAGQLDDQSIADIRRECKLVHGIPILRRDDEEFRAMYNKTILHNLDYEEKLKAMEWFPVTRLFSKKQFSEYLDTIIREYSKQGISIVMPGEE